MISFVSITNVVGHGRGGKGERCATRLSGGEHRKVDLLCLGKLFLLGAVLRDGRSGEDHDTWV